MAKGARAGLLSAVVFIVLALPMTGACSTILTANTMTIKVEPTQVTLPLGDPVVGRAIFHGEKRIKGVVPCSVCHYVEPNHRVLVGPNLHGISKVAGERVPGQSAAEYLETSIRDPEAYTVKGFPPGTMNEKYDERLSDEYVWDIIAYLMTL